MRSRSTLSSRRARPGSVELWAALEPVETTWVVVASWTNKEGRQDQVDSHRASTCRREKEKQAKMGLLLPVVLWTPTILASQSQTSQWAKDQELVSASIWINDNRDSPSSARDQPQPKIKARIKDSTLSRHRSSHHIQEISNQQVETMTMSLIDLAQLANSNTTNELIALYM